MSKTNVKALLFFFSAFLLPINQAFSLPSDVESQYKKDFVKWDLKIQPDIYSHLPPPCEKKLRLRSINTGYPISRHSAIFNKIDKMRSSRVIYSKVAPDGIQYFQEVALPDDLTGYQMLAERPVLSMDFVPVVFFKQEGDKCHTDAGFIDLTETDPRAIRVPDCQVEYGIKCLEHVTDRRIIGTFYVNPFYYQDYLNTYMILQQTIEGNGQFLQFNPKYRKAPMAIRVQDQSFSGEPNPKLNLSDSLYEINLRINSDYYSTMTIRGNVFNQNTTDPANTFNTINYNFLLIPYVAFTLTSATQISSVALSSFSIIDKVDDEYCYQYLDYASSPDKFKYSDIPYEKKCNLKLFNNTEHNWTISSAETLLQSEELILNIFDEKDTPITLYLSNGQMSDIKDKFDILNTLYDENISFMFQSSTLQNSTEVYNGNYNMIMLSTSDGEDSQNPIQLNIPNPDFDIPDTTDKDFIITISTLSCSIVAVSAVVLIVAGISLYCLRNSPTPEKAFLLKNLN
ncbi:hypothetical protein [Endozoicomonas numazuensis]|uniref:Cyclic di-GMP-binding protein n=1 Tax=Endozoicomonas numazuensis TaxID=1137799 RepID=A0A081NGE1_9GAMM|nr:hypothetical protein [Endozoicomonas numazuensis]KEQ17514.1 hypothetical protein GZ78_17320 [Endozoicomonas numazuensis]